MPKTNVGRKTAEKVTAAATGGAVLVHSVPSRKELPSVQASALTEGKSQYECSHCSTKVVASSHAAPSCVACGHSTKQVQASVAPKVGPVVAVECRHCSSVHLMEANVVVASGYHLHCSVCGEANDYQKQASKIEAHLAAAKKVTASEEADLEAEELDAELGEDVQAAGDDGWPFAGVEASGDEAAEPAESEESEESEEAEETKECEEPASDEEPAAVEASEEWPFDGDEPATENAAAEDDLVLEDTGEPLEAAADEDEDDLALELEDLDAPVAANADEMPMNETPEEITAEEAPVEEYSAPDLDTGDSLADALALDDSADGLTLAVTAGRVVAMKGHIAVASLKKENAGSNADVMTTAGFQSAVLHLAKNAGMRKALASVGFQPIRIQSLTAATVARRVQEAQQTAVNSTAEKTASFTESIALAAAGLTRGAWKGKKNPLQAALIEELRTVGVKNPERVVARVLASNLVPTAKVLVEIATELNSMSPNARKETASILGMTEVIASAPEEEVEDEDLEDVQASANDLDGRLRSTASVLPSVLSPSLSVSPRDASRQSVQAIATARALSILDGNAPLMLG